MATNRVWQARYVAGNPAMFSRVTTAAGGPFMRAHALDAAEQIASNGGGWRVWVERADTGERIFESEAEKQHKAAVAA